MIDRKSGMGRFLLNRVIQSIVTILVISIVVFLMARATGDPVTLLASDKATAQDIAELNRSAEVPLVGLGDHRDVCDLRRVRSAGVPLRPDRAINNTSTSIA